MQSQSETTLRPILNRFLLDFPVTMFEGEKSVILTNLTWSGGKSAFLGIAYIMTGAITLLVTFCMIGIHLRNQRKKPLLSDQ